MANPSNLLYTKSHEWVQEMGDGSYRVGLTDYAQDQLGDLVFVNLPQEGDSVEVGAAFGDVESVKAVSDVYSPVTGTVCAINEELLDHPELINQDAYGAWMIQVGDISDKEELLSVSDYEELLANPSWKSAAPWNTSPRRTSSLIRSSAAPALTTTTSRPSSRA